MTNHIRRRTAAQHHVHGVNNNRLAGSGFPRQNRHTLLKNKGYIPNNGKNFNRSAAVVKRHLSKEFAEEIFSIIADNDSILVVAVSESAAQKVTPLPVSL